MVRRDNCPYMGEQQIDRVDHMFSLYFNYLLYMYKLPYFPFWFFRAGVGF